MTEARVRDAEWNEAVRVLREHHLLAPAMTDDIQAPDRLDCHPLLREYFGQRLKQLQPETFRKGHARLFDYYSTCKTPDAFRNPAGLGVITFCSSFPDLKTRLKDAASKRIWPRDLMEKLPPWLRSADWGKIDSIVSMAEGPLWRDAIEGSQPSPQREWNHCILILLMVA
jgi:hypothetical protein